MGEHQTTVSGAGQVEVAFSPGKFDSTGKERDWIGT